MDVTDPHLRRVLKLTEQMIGMPRHLSQHVGGFILTQGALTETVPIGNGAMPERSFIEWDKDDIEALGILKVDVLALGMLTCIRKCLDLLAHHHDRRLTLATVPREDPETYAMLRKGDSLGVFQVESRAQMNMLPRLRPREFYDLVIQVAIVRPGPIQGDMVHPYLKRRRGAERVMIPAPGAAHGPPDELSSILERTLGVPIFQEQAMKIALDAAKFSSAEANRLRKAMATFRSRGMVDELQDMMVERMVDRGYDRDFAQRCFNQIRGFGEYGFPESHAASFAHLVYVSSWLKCHFPAAFGCALLNSQPMGFYAPAQIVRDAREHGVDVLPVDVNCSDWDCTLEQVDKAGVSGPVDREQGRQDRNVALRLGLRQVDGLPEHVAAQLVAARMEGGPFRDVAQLRDRARIGPAHIERLASADAFGSIHLTRRQALWDARSLVSGPDLPLFAHADQRDEGAEEGRAVLPRMPLSEEVVADYQTTRLSLKAHPMAFLRAPLAERGFVRACDLRMRKFRSTVHVAGVVLIRQRPGSAKGVCFITLEDETGVINLVVWPDLKERQRRVVMGARLMEVRGRVEYDDEVIHVIAQHMTDATHELHRLSDDLVNTPIARADHVNNPLPAKFGPRDNLRDGADDQNNRAADEAVEPWQPPPPGNREWLSRREYARTSTRRTQHSPDTSQVTRLSLRMIFSRRIGRFSLDRLALVIIAIAAVVLTARVWLHENPQHDPWAPLNLNDPPGWATQGKLVALRADPEKCRAVMDRSGVAFTLLDETGEGACRRPDRLVLEDEPLSPSPAIATCPVAAGFALWMRRSVQPTAEDIYGSPVVRIDHLGTYNCRRINGASTGQWSEHATGNAIDIAAFVLGNGRRISVLDGWESAPDDAFLVSVRNSACDIFATVLSPDYNSLHADHLHLDQASRSFGGVCR